MTIRQLIRARQPRDEGGFTMVFVALAVLAMMAMVALALDGSQDYASRRHMQNAADGAALAATRKLDQFRSGTAAAATVDTVARTVATANGADGALTTCTIIDRNQATIAPCASTSTWTGNVSAAGVRVATGKSVTTAFGAATGHNSLTANTVAAATIQPLKSGDSPFMICGVVPYQHGVNHQSPPLLNGPPWTVNAAAINSIYELHGPHVETCGASSSFHGIADGPFTLPTYIGISPGVRSSAAQDLLADASACRNGNLNNCLLAVPMCVDDPPATGSGTAVRLYCVAWGVFYVTDLGNAHDGRFVGGSLATGGTTGTGNADPNSIRVIKLVR